MDIFALSYKRLLELRSAAVGNHKRLCHPPSFLPSLMPLPSLTLENSSVQFTYTDSGPVVNDGAYTTLVIIHGHTFHAGTFQRLLPIAANKHLRIVCINRREYNGSTLYSDAELEVFQSGTEAQRAELHAAQGRDLALCLDGLIRTLGIPKAGGIALAGWSLGCTLLCALLASIDSLPDATKARLSEWVHTAIIFQAPCNAFGISFPDPDRLLMPHTDPAIPPEQRPAAFALWVSSYFAHGDLSTRDIKVLSYPAPAPDDPAALNTPTVARLAPAELASMVDFVPGARYDDILGINGPLKDVIAASVQKALWDPAVRKQWSRMHSASEKANCGGGGGIWSVYGTAEPWNIIYTGWLFEDTAKANPETGIQFKVVEGINHFVVWEDPARALDIFAECLPATTMPALPEEPAAAYAGGWGLNIWLAIKRLSFFIHLVMLS
ncbi:AB hydrolase-1 domain-containing protein [Mycena kentingensis (nom. inval.)]|nr:AB hydrolase-1 domain-containing protein [Mycena kentingensis (nom. inval.)]